MRSFLARFKSSSVFPAAVGAFVATAGTHGVQAACSQFLTIYGPIEWWWCSLFAGDGSTCYYTCYRTARMAILDF